MKKKTEFKETEIGNTQEDWEERKIRDCIELFYGKGLPERQRKKGSIPVFGSNGIVGFHDEASVKGPGIIIGRKGSVGEITFSKQDYWPIDTTYYVQTKQGNDMGFWYYFLKTLGLNRMNSHSAVPGLNRDNVYEIDRAIPNFIEQRAIASILGSLDDKIALNRSMNTTLEAIGQALFRRWFVDFEFPNEEGRPYRSSGGEMVETELGEVPKGWKVDSILECADLLSGGTPKTEIPEYWGGDIPWVSAKDVTDAHGSFVIDTERKITQAGIDNSNAKLLPENTTVVTARGTVGSYCILSRQMAINQTNYGLKAKSGAGDFFIFFSISNLVNQMKQNAYGTIFDTITTKTFKEMRISIPPEAMIMSFDYNVLSIMSKTLLNHQESHTLEAIRDALLTKLMSGEIRISINNNLNIQNK